MARMISQMQENLMLWVEVGDEREQRKSAKPRGTRVRCPAHRCGVLASQTFNNE